MQQPFIPTQTLTLTLSFLLLCEQFTSLHAQEPSLLPSIGVDALPNDSAPVCPIPMALDRDSGFEEAGLEEGTIIPDFILYDIDGTPFNATSTLGEGKPLLIVNGSYTCPVFREKLSTINRIVQDFKDELTVAIVYTVEAHPRTDTSVYFGYVNTGKANKDEGVLYRQPRTYGERKAVAADMLQALTIDAPVYLDGPCNNWWEVFGHAPNNAYLIDRDGRIVAKHGWFDRSPHDIDADLNALLGREEEEDDTTTGTFQFILTSSHTVSGPTDDVLYAYGELQNNSNGRVEIDILRRINEMPEGWATSLCTDICLATWVDSTRVTLDPGETQSFTLYFYTGSTADSARAGILFRNASTPQNRYQQAFFGVAGQVSSVEHTTSTTGVTALSVYPNPNPAPATATVSFTLQQTQQVTVHLFDITGKHILKLATNEQFFSGTHTLQLPLLESGTYFLQLKTEAEEHTEPLRVIR